jgi:uncharacterized protein YidB (DUF937 family)
MGLLDEFLQTAGEGGTPADPAQHAALYAEVAKIVAQEGGVPGLVQKFEANGLGGLISGWMGGGSAPSTTASSPDGATIDPAPAPPVPPAAPPAPAASGDQITQLLGPDRIKEIAAAVGLSEQQVTTGIATMLPLIVSHLSSRGGAAGAPGLGSELEGALMGELKAKLFGG